MRRFFHSLLACAITLAGCANLDPETRAGEWHPSGANAINLAAMVTRPSDLTHGVGVASADGQQAADAVLRLRTGHVRPLPDSGLAELQLQSSGNNAVAGGN